MCKDFGHIAHHCRNMKEKESIPMSSNRFEVLKNRVMNIREGSGKEIGKDKKTILRED